jgi:hypothetical protein
MMVMRKEGRKGVKERTGDERCECTGLHHRAFHKTISFIFFPFSWHKSFTAMICLRLEIYGAAVDHALQTPTRLAERYRARHISKTSWSTAVIIVDGLRLSGRRDRPQ